VPLGQPATNPRTNSIKQTVWLKDVMAAWLAHDTNQMIQRLFHYAYCGGHLVDKYRPLNGAHRIVSVFITSLLTCFYFIFLKLVYALSGFKMPEVVFFGMLIVVVAIGWGALKKWQFRQLHVLNAL
jgi:hypothetical protein